MDSRKRARIAITLFFFISGLGFNTWASRIADIQQKFHLNDAELGSILFALPFGLILTLLVTNVLLQRFSSNVIMVVGAMAFNVMLSLIGFATDVWQLVIALFCFGASRNLFNISMNAQSIGVQSLYDRSIITTFHGTWSVGGGCGALLGLVMSYFHVSVAVHFFIVGMLMILLGSFAYKGTLYQPPATAGRRRFEWPDKGLLKFGLISFAVMSCEGTMYDWSSIYFLKAVGTSGRIATTGFVIYMIAMAIARFSGDKIVHRYGAMTLIKYSGILIFTGLFLSAAFPHPVLTGLSFTMVGVGVSCVVPLVFGMAGRSTKMANGPAIAAVSTIGYLGFLLVPPAVGFISEAFSLRWAFALMSSFGIIITVLIILLQQRTTVPAQSSPSVQVVPADRT